MRLRPTRWSRSLAFTLVVISGAMTADAPAGAQTIFMTAPPSMTRVQIRGSAPRTPELAAPARQVDPPLAPAPEPRLAGAQNLQETGGGALLRRLTNTIQGYRLAGETGASEWPIYVTQAQARRKLQFQLGYLASVAVMPEASTLRLMINDAVVGETPIGAVGAVKTVTFEVPAGLIRPGFNAVRISADQRHRVDCSLESTFELWTQIDPTQTGLILREADAKIDNLADLGALLPDEQGALPIRAVLPQNPQPAAIGRVLRAAQLVSLIGRFEQPIVDVGSLAGGRYGVNLVVGPARQLVGALGGAAVGAVDRPSAFVLAATPERRTTIVVTGADSAQVDEAMKLLRAETKPRGAPAGLRAAAAFPAYRLEGAQRVRLRDLGLVSAEFSGRLFRAAFNVMLPPDFYPADYDRATLRVGGGYSPGLTSRARLVVDVNERTAVTLSLLKSSGAVFKDNPLPLPLGFFRPGLNRVEIEAHVPKAGDDGCDPLSALNASKRFLFLDETELELPQLARVARMPDLAATATGGFPYVGSAARPKLYLPSLDGRAIGAALTMSAHLAIAAGRPLDFEVMQRAPAQGEGPTLAVGPLDAFEPALLRKHKLPVGELRQAWKRRIGATPTKGEPESLSSPKAAIRNRLLLQNNFPMACQAGSGVAASNGAMSRPRFANIDYGAVASLLRSGGEDAEGTQTAYAAPAARDLLGEWDAKMRGEKSWSQSIAATLQRMREWGLAKFTDAGLWIGQSFDPPKEAGPVTPNALLAVAQDVSGEGKEDVWTLVTAPNGDDLADAVDCLVDPRVSRQIGGRLSLLDVAQARVTAAAADDARFVTTQPLSVGNMRLIAAGWLSLHSFTYALAALGFALLLAVATRLFVRNVGRSSD
jgi:cellulose synthase operon protein B